MDLVSLIEAIHDQLDQAGVRHAFGGALALGYAATPRGTIDVDVNVFLPPDEMTVVTAALAVLGYAEESTDPAGTAVRYSHPVEPFPIDVFPALDHSYDQVASRVVRHEFGHNRRRLPFLSPEDLCVFKLSFGRDKDWVDLADVARSATDLDVGYIETQLVALRGKSMYPRLARFRSLLP